MISLSAKKRPAPRRAPAARKLSRTVTPTARERFFDRNDIIVSKTDLTGRLTYVNRTFMAISSYEEHELLGQPHSVIRHPDMPRCVFALLWERLRGGKEVFAYVKNMTKPGDFYWTLAHVTPSFAVNGSITGYHSNRSVPERRALEGTIIPLYRSLKEIESREPDRRTGLGKSSERLSAILQEKGIGYDEFVLGA